MKVSIPVKKLLKIALYTSVLIGMALRVITIPLFSQPATGLARTGDTVTVEMQIIDKGVYEYFRTLEQMSGGEHGGAVSTANPLSNMNNGALGYFSAHSTRAKTIVIQ